MQHFCVGGWLELDEILQSYPRMAATVFLCGAWLRWSLGKAPPCAYVTWNTWPASWIWAVRARIVHISIQKNFWRSKKIPGISERFQIFWHRCEHTGGKYDTSGDSPGPVKPDGALWSFLVDLLPAIRNPDFDSIFVQNQWKS